MLVGWGLVQEVVPARPREAEAVRGEIGQVNRLSAAAPQEPGTLSNTPAIWKP
jgi:hypothetical protein